MVSVGVNIAKSSPWNPICVNLPQRSRGEKRTEVSKRGGERQVGEDLLAMGRLNPYLSDQGAVFIHKVVLEQSMPGRGKGL